jgi:hypothetical protein
MSNVPLRDTKTVHKLLLCFLDDRGDRKKRMFAPYRTSASIPVSERLSSGKSDRHHDLRFGNGLVFTSGESI